MTEMLAVGMPRRLMDEAEVLEAAWFFIQKMYSLLLFSNGGLIFKYCVHCLFSVCYSM